MSTPDFDTKYSNEEALRFVQPHTIDSVEECAYVMRRLDTIVGDIDHQLDHAKELAKTGGKYADPNWFVNAKRALKTAKSTRTAVQERKGELSRAEHRAFQRELAQRFMDEARAELDSATFYAIMNRAQRSPAGENAA